MTKIRLLAIVAIFAFGAYASFAQTKHQRGKTQYVTVNLTESGYRPSSFRLKRGVPARITFVRKTEDQCGEVLVMPSYGVRRELPLNQPVLVRLIPRRTGTFSFTCGMNMLRGQIIVN